jgi:acyl-coenzyme A thioesterase PaaI-like protein
MKAYASFVALAVVAMACAQVSTNQLHDDGAGSANGGTAMRLIDTALSKASSAMRSGKAVSITVDNRSVPYAARVVNGRVYVPVRLFMETGQRVIWDRGSMRASVRDQEGGQKRSIDFSAHPTRSENRPPASMRPLFEKGRLWVPLVATLGAFDYLVDWVPSSNRLNIRTNRP